MDLKTFSQNLRSAMHRRGLTTGQLAIKMKVKERRIEAWREGRCYPQATVLLQLSEVLDTSIDDLLKKRP